MSESNSPLDKLSKKTASQYMDAVILGLNDALVELTGALAGFSIALHNSRLIILAGITTGVAATLSMTASEFLAKEVEPGTRNAYLSAFCTGMAYLCTTAILLIPFILISQPLAALPVSFVLAALIIIAFTRTTSRIRGTSFKHDCLQMLAISFGVAVLSFFISWCAKSWWNLDI